MDCEHGGPSGAGPQAREHAGTLNFPPPRAPFPNATTRGRQTADGGQGTKSSSPAAFG
jgi:hypothetical protein